MTSSAAAAVSGLSALDQAIESFINAKPQAQASAAVPHDTVTLSQAATAAPASGGVAAVPAPANSTSSTAA